MTSTTRVSKLARARVSVVRVSISRGLRVFGSNSTSTLKVLDQCLRVNGVIGEERKN